MSMNVAIIGYATEGKVSADYFATQGHTITICDQDESLSIPNKYQTHLGETYLDQLDTFDLIVRSAGIHPYVILRENPDVAAKITTAINEFLAKSPTKNIIGITGTKGKGTTSSLTAAILEASGRKVWLGGNIGRSPLEFIDEVQPDDWVVLELSSFQLYDVKHSPHIAACLMVVPEHLDWHKDIDDYYEAKAQLFDSQKSDDVAIYFADNEVSQKIASHSVGILTPYFEKPGARVCEHGNIEIENSEKICKTDELRLLGKHNWENVCAAITIAWKAGCKDVAKIKAAVTAFQGLPHRLEFVRELDGVRYYEDSFGTTPETAIVAMQAFSEPKIVVLGGSDKGATYENLAATVNSSNVRSAVVIGETGPAIIDALKAVGYERIIEGPTTMPEIVDTCRSMAEGGDVVLLSTGCASFDLFENYKDRGEQFKKAVLALS